MVATFKLVTKSTIVSVVITFVTMVTSGMTITMVTGTSQPEVFLSADVF